MTAIRAQAAAPALQPPTAALKLMSDERLARWAAKGSEAAFAVIFERHHQPLHRYCHSIVGNGHDAADALQNTMLKVLRALPGERREIALKPWLYRIAHNESVSLLRARRGDGELELAAQIGDPAADGRVETRQQLRDLTADLGELTERQRGALLMRELAGLQYSEVADTLGVTVMAAKQSVYEARCALQEMREGRAMDCDLVRRALSDGDRRTLRAMKIRGHLRSCACCKDFSLALHSRPAQLAALAPPLPLAMAASILHGLLGAGAGHGGGGGLAAGLAVGAKAGGTSALAAKVATVVVVAGSVTGGVAYVAPTTPDEAPAQSAAALTPVGLRAAGTAAPAISPAYERDGTMSSSADPASSSASGADRSAARADGAARPSGDAGRAAAAPGRRSGGRPGSAQPTPSRGRRPAVAGAGRTPGRGQTASGADSNPSSTRPVQPPVPAPAAATTPAPPIPASQVGAPLAASNDPLAVGSTRPSTPAPVSTDAGGRAAASGSR